MSKFFNFRINFRLGNFYFETGWFSGEEFKLLELKLLEWSPEIKYLTIFSIQVAKFQISSALNL